MIFGTLAAGDSAASPYTVATSATDSVNTSVGVSGTFQWNVDSCVTLSNPGSQSNADGDTVYLPLTATDSAGNALTYTATSLPSGLSISSTTGVISGTVSSLASYLSPYSVTVTATDSVDTGAGASYTCVWTVAASGTLTVSMTSPGNQTSVEGGTVSLSLSATDSASHALVYAATNLPPGLVIDAATGVISGTVDAQDSANSPYSVTLTATDSVNVSVGAAHTVQWTVHPDVTLANPGSQSTADGDTVYRPLAATDSAGNPLTCSASNLPGGLTVNSTTGAISGTISSMASFSSPYSATVTATDSVDKRSSTPHLVLLCRGMPPLCRGPALSLWGERLMTPHSSPPCQDQAGLT